MPDTERSTSWWGRLGRLATVLQILAFLGVTSVAAVIGLLVQQNSENVTSPSKTSTTSDEPNNPSKTTTPPTNSSVPGSTAPTFPVNPIDSSENVVGTWEGTYRCDKLRGFRLEIVPDPNGSEDSLLATFTFYEVQGNAGSPLGQYVLTGSYVSQRLALIRDYWVKNPGNFTMIDVYGSHDKANSDKMAGDFGKDCHNFELTRTSLTANPPPI